MVRKGQNYVREREGVFVLWVCISNIILTHTHTHTHDYIITHTHIHIHTNIHTYVKILGRKNTKQTQRRGRNI